MNCRIELPTGELRSLSPNFDYLLNLLRVLAPEEIAGTVSVSVHSSGVGLEFAGDRDWEGVSVDSEIIPKWMFAELAFRELIAKRAQQFVELLEGLQPNTPGEANDLGWFGGWALG